MTTELPILEDVSKLVHTNIERLVQIVDAEHKKGDEAYRPQLPVERIDESKQLREQFFRTVAKGLEKHKNREAMQELEKWAVTSVELSIHLKLPLEATLNYFPLYRKALQSLIAEELPSIKTFSVEDAFQLYNAISKIIETSLQYICKQFVSHHVDELEKAKIQLHELSIPLVPVWGEIAVLPIIGDLDNERSEFLHTKTLHRATAMDLSYIVIDLSGIKSIDTWFAQHLSNLIQSLKLLGIEVSLSGMRPKLSQTITQLGIQFKGVPTFLTLEQALNALSRYTQI